MPVPPDHDPASCPPRHIVLAPMEGVINAAMRALLTGIGGYDRCVTEFVRVTDVLLPERVYRRYCPELASNGLTPSGVPVYVQLLGSDPQALAANARRAAALGAPGIDLNFGCPAKTVNNSMGGSVLLQRPLTVATIVRVVREALPAEVPLSVKIRLGYDNAAQLDDIVAGIRAAGADELAIHARTKFDGYRPPAYWSRVGALPPARLDRTVINGEIWSVQDAIDARRASGCNSVMLGRGALAAPDLAARIARHRIDSPPQAWCEVLSHVERQFREHDCHTPRYVGNRTKQWLAYLKRAYPHAELLFRRLRTLHDETAIRAAFTAHRHEDGIAGTPSAACGSACQPVAAGVSAALSTWQPSAGSPATLKEG